jgi:hypothetical protein
VEEEGHTKSRTKELPLIGSKSPIWLFCSHWCSFEPSFLGKTRRPPGLGSLEPCSPSSTRFGCNLGHPSSITTCSRSEGIWTRPKGLLVGHRPSWGRSSPRPPFSRFARHAENGSCITLKIFRACPTNQFIDQLRSSDQALPVTACRAKRKKNGGLGENPPGSMMNY